MFLASEFIRCLANELMLHMAVRGRSVITQHLPSDYWVPLAVIDSKETWVGKI